MGFIKSTVIVLLLVFPLSSGLFPAPEEYSDADCLSCHGKKNIAQTLPDGQNRSLYVDTEDWNRDVHSLGKMTCVDCHTQASPFLHFREGFRDVDCARCHPEPAENYLKNIHFEFRPVSQNKELPQCFHCHTKHRVLLHDDPESSVSSKNIGETCGRCHPEVMIRGILRGSSLGKISGHRKGDLSEGFEMKICISCHYEDSAHGTRVYKDFCVRCHDVSGQAGILLGPTHLDSIRWKPYNAAEAGLTLLFIFGVISTFVYRSRKGLTRGIKAWYGRMKIEQPETSSGEQRESSRSNEEPPS